MKLMRISFNKKILYAIMATILVLFAGLSLFLCQPYHCANAIFVEQITSDDNFSMKMTANGRRSNNALPLDKRTSTTTLGKEIEYICFQWKDLESLGFRFSSNIKASDKIFRNFQFKTSFQQTDNLSLPFDECLPTTLYEGTITGNNFSQFDFFYYIDSNNQDKESNTSANGHDFGIYKFDFSYDFHDNETMDEGTWSTYSIGEIYVAVLPDDIDSISSFLDLSILYSISSSNKLMNVFNLYLSNDAFKYINPAYIQWSVTGTDTMNVNYVLTQKMKDENLEYANHKVLWQSPVSTTGPRFIFDSNDIEGTWSVTCSIKNSDGQTEKYHLNLDNLSTIKKSPKSFLWLFIFIGCLLVVGAIVSIIIVVLKNKKHDKVW